MIKPIYLYDSTVLRMPTKPVVLMTDEIEQTLVDLADTLKAVGGLGLSAPQIGVSYKIIVMTNGKNEICFINPEVISFSTEQEEMLEGCLSFPGLGVYVKRPTSITVVAKDVTGAEREYELEGMLARIFQHEVDHLNGVLFVDLADKVWSIEGETTQIAPAD